MEEIDLLKIRFSEIEELFENGEEDDHQLIFDLEEKMQEVDLDFYEDEVAEQFYDLKKQIKVFKREYEFYDSEAELDRMFPDLHDENFDEDQMSWNSVFGD